MVSGYRHGRAGPGRGGVAAVEEQADEDARTRTGRTGEVEDACHRQMRLKMRQGAWYQYSTTPSPTFIRKEGRYGT
ncbi:hypothetical protein Pmani_023635 [Petrolisthes manimaculis]|uniref:Uncharacterized protein n=1 Tax=Petrolisthes manimaculis TaxID=1843537 RepID=A0AAE1PBD7_9EUCA|nr:hypothetical protein Pmani_023635 [Petrolisthes manimaculis]